MKRVVYMLIVLVLVLLVSACDPTPSREENKGIFNIINSSDSTNRIVRVYANEASSIRIRWSIPGDGIHKGDSKASLTKEGECDISWVVEVVYNDTAMTHCRLVHYLPCGGVKDYVFNNTNC